MTKNFCEYTVEDVLAATASKEPIPGGGGIAALTAASAAALVEMVANLTIGKEQYADVERLMKQIVVQAATLRTRYLQGIDADGAAFSGVITAVRLPKDTPARKEKVQQAFKKAAQVPFELGKDIFRILELAEQVVQFGNAWVITDGAIAAMNARAAMRSSFYSVRINLQSITDEEFVTAMERSMKDIEERAALIEEVGERKYRERR